MKAKFIVPVYALKDLGLDVSELPTGMQQVEIRFDDDNDLAPVTLHWPNQPDSPALKNDIIDCMDTWMGVWQGLELAGYKPQRLKAIDELTQQQVADWAAGKSQGAYTRNNIIRAIILDTPEGRMVDVISGDEVRTFKL